MAFKSATFNHTGGDVITLYAAIDGINNLRNRIMDCQKNGLAQAKIKQEKEKKKRTRKKPKAPIKEDEVESAN